jgi:hypothetical protein
VAHMREAMLALAGSFGMKGCRARQPPSRWPAPSTPAPNA